MSECHTKPNQRYKIWLQFFAVGLGCLLCALLAIYFARKWYIRPDREFTVKLIPRLTAIIVTALAMERSTRLVEVYLMHWSNQLSFNIIYHTNNIVWLSTIFCSLCLYLTSKLTIAFDKSVYEITDRERMLLYILSALIIFTVQSLYVLNGIPEITKSTTGSLILSLIPVFLFGLGLIFMFKVDSSFASRLRTLVVNDEKHKRRIASMNSDERKGMAMRASFAGIKQVSVSNFDANHQKLLVTAGKSMVSAVFISISCLLLSIVSALFAIGECEQWPPFIANCLIAISFPLISVSVSFTLPDYKPEYEQFCSIFDKKIRKIVAWQTHREVYTEMNKLPTVPDDEEVS